MSGLIDFPTCGFFPWELSRVSNQPPVAAFAFTPAAPRVGEAITFLSTATDPDGQLVQWVWTFGDGNSAQGASVTHVYTGTGPFTVTLTVTDNGGLTASLSQIINATNATPLPLPPIAVVLPSSRSVRVGTPATAFATMINISAATAIGCSLVPATQILAGFVFQTTNPTTNQVTGLPNTPVNIPAGGTMTFVFAFTPTAVLTPTEVALNFSCANSALALSISGLNTLLLAAVTTPTPDIIALAATLKNDDIVHIPGTTGTGVFAVATANVGATGALTVSADTGSTTLPVQVALCETNPTSGQCLDPLTGSVTTQIDANETPTFGVFVTGTGPVAFDPAAHRIFVRFKDAGGVTRGATSVAVQTQ